MSSDLAAIVERDRAFDPSDCEACREYASPPSGEDRRVLLGLLREAREALRESNYRDDARRWALLDRLAVLGDQP